ncbi:hypothetical protein C1645_836463, partial [Glomus cerebriforme]
KLAAASKTPTSLNQKSKVDVSAEQKPIVIEDEDITISSTRKGSTSTIDTNDTIERIEIANAESLYMTQSNDQQPNQEVVHMETDKENPKPQTTEEVRKPDESSKKKKLKKKEFMPYIITGHTVPPKLKNNIRDIMLYDVPGDWDAEKIMEAINKHLGSLIKATLRKQDKYYTLGSMIVRWFPGDWTLEMRKERLHHQAVIRNLPDDLTELKIYMEVDATINNPFKSIKIVKDNKEKREKAGGKYNKKNDSKKKGSDKKKSKDTSSSKNKSNKKKEGRKQDSIADILAKALAKILAGQEKSGSRKGKKNKLRGSSRS